MTLFPLGSLGISLSFVQDLVGTLELAGARAIRHHNTLCLFSRQCVLFLSASLEAGKDDTTSCDCMCVRPLLSGYLSINFLLFPFSVPISRQGSRGALETLLCSVRSREKLSTKERD